MVDNETRAATDDVAYIVQRGVVPLCRLMLDALSLELVLHGVEEKYSSV